MKLNKACSNFRSAYTDMHRYHSNFSRTKYINLNILCATDADDYFFFLIPPLMAIYLFGVSIFSC